MKNIKYIFILLSALAFSQVDGNFGYYEQLRQSQISTTVAIPIANLFAYYGFNNDTLDAVGSNDFVVNTGTSYATGNSGEALSVPTGGFPSASINDDDAFSFTNGSNDLPFSISFYIKFTSAVDSNHYVLGKRNENAEWLFAFFSGIFNFSLYGQGTTSTSIRCVYPWNPVIGDWYHVTGTYDGLKNQSGINLYIDGVNVGGQTTVGTYTGTSNTTSPVFIGYKIFQQAAADHDGLGFWDKELSSAEVTAIYNEQNSGNELL